jgi:hypothetical protein
MFFFLLVQKKRVWFPDPEFSSVLFYDDGQSITKTTRKRCSHHVKRGTQLDKRRKAGKYQAAVSADASVQHESPVSALSASLPGGKG